MSISDIAFEKIIYRRPYQCVTKKYIEEIVGLDTEAYLTGEPFLFCTSYGDWYELSDIPQVLFTRQYRNTQFVTYNLKYDSGALIYNLDVEAKTKLWLEGKCVHGEYTYTQIPDKMLRISKGKNAVTFWDMYQFYKMSLDKASQKYLGKGKISVETKSFTPEYVKKNFQSIIKYCTTDAVLVKELADYLLHYLHKFGIRPNKLYSVAYVGYEYFKRNSTIVNSWRYWIYYPEVLKQALRCYAGGKFEVSARGIFNGYEYDISSAYPYEIGNLMDISTAHITHTKKYIKTAQYGMLRVVVDNRKGLSIPAFKRDMFVNIYPAGVFEANITKQEYDYMTSIGVDVYIQDGYWLRLDRIRYPYRDVVDRLYHIKQSYKSKDIMISNIAKVMTNSFYGKMIQMIRDFDGSYVAGSGWNPIFSAIVTANVRIKMSQYQNALQDDCLAVHTDSILTRKKLVLKDSEVGIGSLQFKKQGDGVIILSGMYQISDKIAHRGLPASKKFSWYKFLDKLGDKSIGYIPTFTITTWRDAVSRKSYQDINRPTWIKKRIDLNMDSKRLWLSNTYGKKLLTGLEYSEPRLVIENVRRLIEV